MAKFQSVLGTQVAVTGNTTIVIDDRVWKQSTNPMWCYGAFGYSMTTFTASTGNIGINIYGQIGPATIPIAAVTSIGSLTSGVIPIAQAEAPIGTYLGSTRFASIGIPTPRQIVFGNSGIVGKTYACVVTAMLYSPE